MKLNKQELTQILDTSKTRDDFILDTEKICIDSRKISSDSTFFAIKGANFDGNCFVQQSIDSGTKSVICQKNSAPSDSSANILCYDNDRKALYDLAKLALSKSKATRFCITGSNGKTSTKEILTTLLSSEHKTHKTLGNFNNDIGLPLTIFKLTPTFTATCLEVGMNQLREIDYLSSLVQPKISIITNIGRAHLQFLKTLQNVAIAKCELIPHTKGTIIVNADHEILVTEAQKHNKKLLFFSTQKESDIYMKKLISTDSTSSTFILHDKVHNDEMEIHLPIPGRFNIENFLSSYLAARLSGVSKEKLLTAVKNLTPTKGRYDPISVNGINIINDGYNANPDSMEAGIINFADITAQRKVVLLGDMCELGDKENELHESVGKTLASLNIDLLVTFGDLGKKIEEGARQNGFTSTKSFLDFNKLINFLKQELKQDDYLYIKASNATKLYRVSEELKPRS
jgi:UDP-N-acetylmuramoyl-tripeptide--D-alanyl-D-alanine ligase